MNEAQKRRKYRAIKVIITEFFMVLSVIALVFTLTFIVMGYKIGDDGELEQDGFLQIRTAPTGAVVTIDDEQLLTRTNLSKAISAGEHEVSFSKDGYDTWKKTILVTSGLTYRLNYPKLFLKERVEEKIAGFDGLDFTSVSPDDNSLIVAPSNTKKWQLFSLSEGKPTVKNIDLVEIFPEIESENFSRIKILKWNDDSDKILALAEWNDKREWLFIDIKDPKSSKNLTQEFGMDFADIKMKNKSGEQLFILENGNLRKLNISTAEVSRILLSNVERFYNFDSDIIYVGKDEDGKREFGFYQEGNNESSKIMELEDSSDAKMAMGEYYGDVYTTFVVNNNVKIYRGNFGAKQEKNVLLVDEELDFVPSEVNVRGGGELAMLRNGKSYAVYDVETNKFTRYELENGEIKWMSEFMFSFVDEKGNLIAEDFDKGNRRKVVANVKSGFETPIVADKWIYYVDLEFNLKRVKIAD
ncbi:PEGA domain-containing protein [Candidatus Saccharibacteria bacterium]|nr:PEGA domain-containing protein [Candidatus Saccharibacteria bacterium]